MAQYSVPAHGDPVVYSDSGNDGTVPADEVWECVTGTKAGLKVHDVASPFGATDVVKRYKVRRNPADIFG